MKTCLNAELCTDLRYIFAICLGNCQWLRTLSKIHSCSNLARKSHFSDIRLGSDGTHPLIEVRERVRKKEADGAGVIDSPETKRNTQE